MQSISQFFNRVLVVIRILFVSLKIWGISKFFRFWLFNQKEKIVRIGNLLFSIRADSFKNKLVDLTMLLECVYYKNYDSIPGFKIAEADTVIDIGGHIGSFSVYAATNAAKGKVFSFEPSPHNFNQVARNKELNRLKNLHIFQKAVSGKKGSLTLYLDEINTAANSVSGKGKPINVPAVSLNDVFRECKIKRCNFLKIDCEGAEYDIFFNTSSEVFKKIDRIACEYHEPKFFGLQDTGYTVSKLVSHLEKNGFEVILKKTNSYQGIFYAKNMQVYK